MAETNGLLNRHTGITGIEGSNPSVSATFRPILNDRVPRGEFCADGRIRSAIPAAAAALAVPPRAHPCYLDERSLLGGTKR